MTETIFARLCSEMGCSPGEVVNARINSREVVALVRRPSGGMAVMTFDYEGSGLSLRSVGRTFGRRDLVAVPEYMSS